MVRGWGAMELLVLPLPLLIFDARLSHDVFSSRGPFTVSVDLFPVPWGVPQFEKGPSCPLQALPVEVVAGGQLCYGRTVKTLRVPSSAEWQWWQRGLPGANAAC